MSLYATQHNNHADYVNAVIPLITPLTQQPNACELTQFVNSIINDPHFAGVLARCPTHPALPDRDTLAQRPNCRFCLYPNEQDYVRAMHDTFENFDPCRDWNELEALAAEVEHDTYFPALVKHYPIVLSYLPPTQNAALAITALEYFVDFLRLKPDADAMELLDDEASDDDMDTVEFATTIATFYGDSIREHLGENEAVIVAALKAAQGCGYNNPAHTPMYDEIMLAFPEGPEGNVPPKIAKHLINAYPNTFFSAAAPLQSNLELLRFVLPNNAFLYHALPSHIQQQVQHSLPELPTLDDALKAEANFKRAVTYCHPDLLEEHRQRVEGVIERTYHEAMGILNGVQNADQEVARIRHSIVALRPNFQV